MARFIPEPSEQNGRGWGIDSLQGNQLLLCRRTGEAMKVVLDPNAGLSLRTRVTLFLRVTNVGLVPLISGQSWLFHGYVSDRREALEGMTIDALDPRLVQFVVGTVSGGTGIVEAHEPGIDDDAPGAEPWIIKGGVFGASATIGTVLARSEAEAARRCGFTRTEETFCERAIYIGTSNIAIAPGRLPRIQLFPLSVLTKFPLP